MSRRIGNSDTMRHVKHPGTSAVAVVHGVTRQYDSCVVPKGQTITLEEWRRQQAAA